MKNNLGIFILIAALLITSGLILSSKSSNLGGYRTHSTYLTDAPTQATTSVGFYITNGNPTTIVSENTARTNLSLIPYGDIYIWLANSTSSSMTQGGGIGSSGIFIADGEIWDMEDYGIIWPGIIYGMASSTTSTAQYIDYIGN